LCARHPDPRSLAYEEIVRAEIGTRRLEDNVILITDYLPDTTAQAMLRATDAIVLPYRETAESSSAALRFVLPLQRPVIATDLAIFADARDALLIVDPTNPTGIGDAVRRVLMDDRLQEDLAARAEIAARRFRVQRVVADHREIYAAARTAYRRRDAQVSTGRGF
jgi:glycosyltransferase involved in cell wall biosynthesis